MNVAQQLREIGFAALLATNAETLTFRDAPLEAVVNRRPERKTDGRTPNLDELAASVIEFRDDALALPPRVGEYFTDQTGATHRIERIPRLTDFTWRVECVVSPSEGPGS